MERKARPVSPQDQEAQRLTTERDFKLRDLFQRLSWSNALAPAQFAPDGTPRAGKIERVEEGGAQWRYSLGIQMPQNGNPAELALLFCTVDETRSSSAHIQLSYNDDGYVCLRDSRCEQVYYGKLYLDGVINSDVQKAVASAFTHPVMIDSYEYDDPDPYFRDRYYA